MLTTMPGIQTAFAADHDRLDKLFSHFLAWKWTDMPRAREAFKEFKVGLQRHIVWEEQILFPRFEEKTGITEGGPTAVMRAEHQRIGEILEAIHQKVQRQDPNSDAEEGRLLETLGAHNEKEEMVLYPALDRLLSDDEKTEVFEAMERVPEEAYGRCCGRH